MKKNEKNGMRALLAILLVIATVLSCAACAGMSPKSEDAAYYLPNQNQCENAERPGDKQSQNEGEPAEFVENPFIATSEQNISTFSADVDTASYGFFRKMIGEGVTTEWLRGMKSAFRTEEFVNYFRYDMEQPEEGELFRTKAKIAECPWNPSSRLLTLTMQAEKPERRVPNNLVFLIDVSGSMQADDKLPLLKKAFATLIASLTPGDTVSIVTYSGEEKVVLRGCNGGNGQAILDAVNGLSAYGATNGQAGLQKAYQVAEQYRVAGGNNRIIMASDGDLNVGISSEAELISFIEKKRETGIFLSVLGFGTGNYRDSKMEAIADHGNGVYYYIDGEKEAEKVFGSDLLSTLYTVAKDVKLQMEFDPRYVASYRLIGYENRILSTEDFTDDQKDAGEVGAGHQVTVCYEMTLTENAAETEDPWMQLRVRWKHPEGTESVEDRYEIGSAVLQAEPDEEVRFISAVIETVMLLHESRYAQNMTVAGVLENLDSMDLSAYPDRAEFRELVRRLVEIQKKA